MNGLRKMVVKSLELSVLHCLALVLVITGRNMICLIKEGINMKLTIEGNSDDIKKVLQAISGSKEHDNKIKKNFIS
jgi:hypothetical protein